MDIISSIKQVFSRPANASAEMDRLVRFAKSKQGIKLTAQLMQQTDSLTKKGHCRMEAGVAGGHQCGNTQPRTPVRRLYGLYSGFAPDGLYRPTERQDPAKGVPFGRQGRQGKRSSHSLAEKGVVFRLHGLGS